MEWLTMTAAFLFVSCFSAVTAQDPTYAVLIPQLMRPGQEFDVCVNILQTTGDDVTVVARLQSTSDNKVLVSNSATYGPGSQNSMTLSIPSTDLETEYRFEVEGSGGLTFSNQSLVSVSFKSLIILIQTDKAIYQPSQTVMFRIMAVDADLKPYSGTFEVAVFDHQDNKLMQIRETDTDDRDCSLIMGGELPLADEPPLGEWKIEAKTETGETEEKKFKVENYVLPTVEVTLSLPSFFHHSMESIEIVVIAQYTYGQPVKGTAVVEIYLRGFSEMDSKYQKSAETYYLENGEVRVTLNHDDILELYECNTKSCSLKDWPFRYTDIIVKATVTDNVTNEEMVKEGQIHIEYNLLMAEFMSMTPGTYKQGLQWTGYGKVTRADGKPLQGDDRIDEEGSQLQAKVEFTYTPDRNSEVRSKDVVQYYDVADDGIVMIEEDMEEGYISVYVQLTYPADGIMTKSGGSSVSASKTVDKAVSRDDKVIQVSVMNQNEVIKPSDDPVTFEVETGEEITMFWFKILSKGNIVHQGKVVASGKTNTFDVVFDEDLAQSASPTARVIVWYFTASGEVIVDSMDLAVDGTFANDVQLKFSRDQVEPGESVDVTVTAEPRSCVGVLAVDKSVLLLNDGNDISRGDVLDGLEGFDSNKPPVFPGPWFIGRRRKKRSIWWYPRYISGKDAKEVFDNAGVIMLTDGYVHEEPDSYYYSYRYFDDGNVGAGVPESESDDNDVMEKEGESEQMEEENVREVFPETWLWFSFNDTGNKDQVVFSETAPDTITSWVATAVAISKKNGIGIMETPAELTVFKSCFADIRLPVSAIRDEILQLKVVIFNYEDSKQTVTVTLKEAADDAFYASDETETVPSMPKEVVQKVKVEAGDGEDVLFSIKPVKLGDIPVEVHISSKLCSDALRKDLTVEPEGEPCDYSEGFFFSLKKETESRTMDIVFPDDVVSDSQRISVTTIGDIMGASVAGLDKLIKQPYGCGEQNMLNFAPNIYVLDYFEATNTGTPEQISKAKKFLEEGFQNELNFKHPDGSYSAFGARDKSGSSWLTAFVLRCFRQAASYLEVDQDYFNSGTRFLLDNQNVDGSFMEPGRVLHSAMQGQASRGLPMTAYIAKVLTELVDTVDEGLQSDVELAISKTESYLKGELEDIKKNAYTLGLVCYFLCEVDSNKADKCLEYFEALQENSGGGIYWDLGDSTTSENMWIPPYRKPPSNNIETTAYGLLIYCLKDDEGKAAAVTKWLSSKRSSLGGYSSTQDTVIGLQALSTFASKVSLTRGTGIDVTITWDGMTHSFDTITGANADVLQLKEISDASDVSSMEVEVDGTGMVLVQVNVFFNKNNSAGSNGFEIEGQATEEDDNSIKVQACFKSNLKETGMSVVEIKMLTGYKPVMDNLVSKYESIGLKKVEKKDKTVAFYFDEITNKKQCVEVLTGRSSLVENLKPALMQVYSYYRSDARDSVLYLPEKQVTSECGLDKKWRKKIKAGKLECFGKRNKGCKCRELNKKENLKLLKKVCKRNIKGGAKACCKFCKANDFPIG